MNNSDDPRSFDYHRIYNKTPINFFKFFMVIMIYLLILIPFLVFEYSKWYFLLFTFLYFLINIKNFLLLSIKIYQYVAPISIRSKCRFEPSCSNYMLICLEKYGLIKGIKKGIGRIKRCNINDGGYDYP